MTKPKGSMRLWHDAQTGFLWCISICSRIDGVCALPAASAACVFSAGTFGGGGGGGTPIRASMTHLPRMHGRGAVRLRGQRQDAPLPSSPRRSSNCRELHAPEVAALDVRDPVVLRQPLVDEGVVGIEQIQDAAVLAQDAVEEQLRLLDEGLAQVVVEIRIVRDDRLVSLEAAQIEPLPREVLRERERLRVLDHAMDLRGQHLGIAELFCSASFSSSSSGMLLHRKNDSREASSRSLIW